jgi:capsular polysaccharide biosynthesis protein
MDSREPPGRDLFQITLRDLVSPLFRHWRILLATFVSVFALVAWLGLRSAHRYASHMTISIQQAHDSGEGNAAVSTEVMQSMAALVKSRDLLEKVVLTNHLQQKQSGPAAFGRGLHDGPEQAVRTLAGQLDVSILRHSNLMEISYSSPDPALAAAVLSSLGRFYVAQNGPRSVAAANDPLPQKAGPAEALIAVPPATPVLPVYSTGSILWLAFFIAVTVTCFAGYLTQYFDPFFHSPAEVSEILGIRVVEAVPKKLA